MTLCAPSPLRDLRDLRDLREGWASLFATLCLSLRVSRPSFACPPALITGGLLPSVFLISTRFILKNYNLKKSEGI